jgi:hypothetical protein
MHLDAQARLDITHWAEQYISGLVESNNGDREDVRTVIHDLHYQVNVIDHDGNPHVAVRPVGNPAQHPDPAERNHREESSSAEREAVARALAGVAMGPR